MASQKAGSKADTLVKVILVFFISLLSFSVGTFVGKQVSDSDHRRLALEGEFKADRQVASTDAKADSADKITDKEVESLTEEFVNKEKAAADQAQAADGDDSAKAAAPADQAKADDQEKTDKDGYKKFDRGTAKVAQAEEKPAPQAKAETKPEHKKMAMKADATHKAAEKVAKGKAPSDGMKAERKPASTLPSVANAAIGKYTVQVGSYPDEKMAQNKAAELKGKGWNAFYFPANIQGKTWYRVSVGIFDSVKNAREFSAQFKKDANTKSAIVQKIVQ